MTGHVPFDANRDWANPYCGNTSNDPLVDKLIGNAYHVVRTVYCNLGNLKLIYDFLNQYGMVLGVQSEAELKAMTVSASYARLYGFDNTNKRTVTDYLYVEGDRTGVIPDNPAATGSWILVASSTTGGGGDGDDGATPPYIIYTYNQGAALGGESTIPVPTGTVGVPMIVVEGQTNIVGYGFNYDATTLTVTLAQPLETGDEVHLFLTGTPAVPDNPNVTDWVQINWLYNGGYASGGEQVILIPYTFQSVPAIYKNGDRYYQGLADKSYTVDSANQRILLTEALATNDRLIVTIGGESETLIMSERTIQELARSANVKDTETILSTNTTQYLNGMKIIYDVVAQKTYGLPSLPTNAYIGSVSNGQLTYGPGSITVDLLPLPDSAEAIIPEVTDAIKEYYLSTVGAAAVTASNGWSVERFTKGITEVTPEQFIQTGEVMRNGTNDDAVQINRAFTYLESIGGGRVRLSGGTYYQNTQVIIPENCTLSGSGMFSTKLRAMDTMDRTFNSITTKNNLMYLYAAGTEHPDYTDYTYISGVAVEDLTVDANHLGRDPTRSGTPTSVQACGIKFTSVKHSRISRCFVTHALLHGFDVSAMTYFNDGNYTHNIDGGSEHVVIEDCFGMNTLYDDIFTCHNSRYITFRKCHAYNDGTDSNMLWQNNQHAFEIDEGNRYVLVEDCVADYLMCGFQAKGHDTTLPAQEVTFRRCHAKNCAWSFQVEHLSPPDATLGVLARGVLIEDCISENAYNDRYEVSNNTYRARAMWLRGYECITIRNMTVIRGKGLIELDRGVTSVTIDGLLWKGGYYGVSAGSTNAGLITVTTSQTYGHHTFKNIRVTDPVTLPVVRCVDTTLTQGITIENIWAKGYNSLYPCIFMTLNIPASVKDITATGFSLKLWDTSGGTGWQQYPVDLDFSITAGWVQMRTPNVPDGAIHPARNGNTAVSKTTGKLYSVVGSSINNAGTWSLVGSQA